MFFLIGIFKIVFCWTRTTHYYVLDLIFKWIF